MRHVQDEITVLVQKAGGDPREQVDDITNKINVKAAVRAATQGRRQAYTERYKERKKKS